MRTLLTARADIEFKKGKDLMENGDSKGALAAFEAAVNVDGANPQANYYAAKLTLVTHGDLKQASSYAQRAVDSDQRNPPYRELYAKILDQAGMKAMARKQFEELLRLDPENGEAKKQLKRRWPF